MGTSNSTYPQLNTVLPLPPSLSFLLFLIINCTTIHFKTRYLKISVHLSFTLHLYPVAVQVMLVLLTYHLSYIFLMGDCFYLELGPDSVTLDFFLSTKQSIQSAVHQNILSKCTFLHLFY